MSDELKERGEITLSDGIPPAPIQGIEAHRTSKAVEAPPADTVPLLAAGTLDTGPTDEELGLSEGLPTTDYGVLEPDIRYVPQSRQPQPDHELHPSQH